MYLGTMMEGCKRQKRGERKSKNEEDSHVIAMGLAKTGVQWGLPSARVKSVSTTSHDRAVTTHRLSLPCWELGANNYWEPGGLEDMSPGNNPMEKMGRSLGRN